MTSMKALNYLWVNASFDGDVSPNINKYYDTIKKDLEILEILKPKIKNCINFLNFCNNEENAKIKEWLDK